MRVNQPITDHEVEVPDGEPLVSRTDPGGRIVFVNHVFVETSGFTEQELVGSPHNIVRHPHMPQQAFANLWATIKAGRPWDGLVKNRSKTGDFYWVRAKNVTPVVENGGEVAGYISIRSKPARVQIDTTDRAYAAIRAGNSKGIALADGELVRSGPFAWLAGWAHSAGTGTVAGRDRRRVAGDHRGGLARLRRHGRFLENEALQAVVYDRDLVSVNQLRMIVDRIRDNRNHIAQMTIALGRGTLPEQVLGEREPPVRANMNQIAELWRAYSTGGLTTEQRPLVEKFDHQLATLVHDVINPAFNLAHRGETVQLNTLFEKQAAAVCSRRSSMATRNSSIDRSTSVMWLTRVPQRHWAGI